MNVAERDGARGEGEECAGTFLKNGPINDNNRQPDMQQQELAHSQNLSASWELSFDGLKIAW